MLPRILSGERPGVQRAKHAIDMVIGAMQEEYGE